MADGADEKKNEGPGLATIFFVSVLGSLTVIGIVEGVKYMARRQQQPGMVRSGFFALPDPGYDRDAWEFVE